MKKPDVPLDEARRIGCLHSLCVLDTPAEERFDRYTRLVQRIIGVPIAVVSLVDGNRQWFKSVVGLDAIETSREVSFCGHAILGDDTLIVNDATKDERFADNPLVTGEPGIRFYAGVPLCYMDGSKLGTLCVIDTQPREINQPDIDILSDIAALVSRELETVQLAILDDLTGISNRRGFKILAQKSLDICCRKSIDASLVFFDLNGFKKINDEFGHAEGDRALMTFAQLMKNSFRSSDVFARLGGDEFVVLFTDTSSENAQKIVESFRDDLARKNQRYNRGYHINFCAGVVAINVDDGASIDSLLDMADTIMYERKSETLRSL